MTKPAAEFEVTDGEVCLIYRPRDDTRWVHERFSGGEELLGKGTFYLTPRDLIENANERAKGRPLPGSRWCRVHAHDSSDERKRLAGALFAWCDCVLLPNWVFVQRCSIGRLYKQPSKRMIIDICRHMPCVC